MKAGASDYVIKGHVGRIGPAIRGALEMKRLAIEREQAYELLFKNELRYRTLFETMAQGIVYFDADGVVTSANPAAERILGVSLSRMLGLTCIQLFGKALDQSRTELAGNMLPGMTALHTGRPVNNFIMGVFNPVIPGYRWISVTAVPQYTAGDARPSLVYMTMEDITELKTGQDMLTKSLQEKEVLIKEIHHRVKNNMQIISSMLNLQGSYNRNPELKDIIVDMQNRIKSMAIIHEELYRSNDLSEINFGWCLQNLTNDLLYSYAADPALIKIRLDVADVRLSIDTSLPCSLIINELVSNALKYAFPGGREGEVFVSMHKDESGACTLVVRDNGVGIPQEMDMEKVGSMGLLLVKLLVRQIGGTLAVRREAGTEYAIRFKEHSLPQEKNS